MLRIIRDIGLWLGSLKGLAYAVSLFPTIAAAVAGFFEDRPWSEIILIATGTLALGLLGAYYFVSLLVRARSYFVSRAGQKQIAKRLSEYTAWKMDEIDTQTAAAIWAGTRDEASIDRHVKFRAIKDAISKGRIKNTRQKYPPTAPLLPGPNKYTWVPVSEFREYLILVGAVRKEDLEQ